MGLKADADTATSTRVHGTQVASATFRDKPSCAECADPLPNPLWPGCGLGIAITGSPNLDLMAASFKLLRRSRSKLALTGPQIDSDELQVSHLVLRLVAQWVKWNCWSKLCWYGFWFILTLQQKSTAMENPWAIANGQPILPDFLDVKSISNLYTIHAEPIADLEEITRWPSW